MDPQEGEVVRQRLQAFIEHAATEQEPSEEGWHLFELADQAFSSLAVAYEATGPKHLAAPVDVQSSGAIRDTWLVEMFDRINQDMWVRLPGDRLTLRQKVDIVGQILTVLLVAGLVIGLFVYMGMSADEWEVGRRNP